MVDVSIASALGAGSGIDIRNLVNQLSAAARGPAEAQINARESRNQARISALAEVSAGITDFAASLTALVATGSLASRPTVSAPELFTATALPGARLAPLSASVEVVRTAAAQTVVSTHFATASEAVGTGTLSFAFADRSFDVTIDAANASLDGIAAAVTAAGQGVTASVVTDAGGARLLLRGPSGDAGAFTVAVTTGDATGLERLAYPGAGGLGLAQSATNAAIRVDGVEIIGASNSFTGAIPGVSIEVKAGRPGFPATIGVERPTEALRTAIGDFVTAYNSLITRIDQLTANRAGEASGPARGDTAIAALRGQLSRLPGAMLGSVGDGPATMAEIGVKTNRDGMLAVDQARLSRVLADDAAGVERLFAPPAGAGGGLPAAMRAIKDGLTTGDGAFTSANQRLGAEAKRIAADRAALERRSAANSAQLLATFSAMDRRVSGFKATQSFLEQQVKVWTASR